MRLLINTATTFKGGGLQVAKSFIEECRHFPEHEYHVILSPNLSKLLNPSSFENNFHFYKINYRPAARVFSVKSPSEFMQAIADKVQPDVAFTTTGPAYWRPDVPHLMGYNLPHYIYPESVFFKLIPWWRRIRFFFKGAAIIYFFKHDADAFVVQTDAVKHRLQKKLHIEKVHTVSNTCSALYFQPHEIVHKLPVPKEGEFRLLLLSAYYFHKGFDMIPLVITELKKRGIHNVKFVLTLPKEDFENIFPAHLRPWIHNVGPVKVEECPGIYKECDALFLPTLLECFSVSYVEAMAMKKPILTSDLDFAHTVCEDAAIYFDPVDKVDITEKILMLIRDPQLQKTLIKKGLDRLGYFNTARQRAEKYLQLCEQLIPKKLVKH